MGGDSQCGPERSGRPLEPQRGADNEARVASDDTAASRTKRWADCSPAAGAAPVISQLRLVPGGSEFRSKLGNDWAIRPYPVRSKRVVLNAGAEIRHEVTDKTAGRCTYQRDAAGAVAGIEVQGVSVTLRVAPQGDRILTFGGVPLAVPDKGAPVQVRLLAGGGIPEIDGLTENPRRPGVYSLIDAKLPTTDGSACEITLWQWTGVTSAGDGGAEVWLGQRPRRQILHVQA